jgi:chorismate dehydratase
MIRLGSIEFINSLPVDLGLLSGEIPFLGRVIPGVPSRLNPMMLNGELDISPVSALFYAQHAEEFAVLPDLSISSDSGVMSVLLFSRHALGDLRHRKIFLTGKGRTTPALLEMICRLRYGFIPQTEILPAGRFDPTQKDAVLLIGDEALLEKERLTGLGFEAMDLAEEWRRWTGFPLVFALWVARREALAVRAEAVEQAHEAILSSKNWGLTHLDRVLEAAVRKLGLPQSVLETYFSKLSYGWSLDLERGLNQYLEFAVRCGLLERKREEILR